MGKKLDLDKTATHKTLLLFVQLLFSGRRHYLADLAELLRCSKATVMRMMETIEFSGVVEIETGLECRRRWYQLRSLPGRPHIGLSEAEVEKLALCRDLLQRFLPEGVERIVSQGIEKVSALMPHPEERGAVTSPKAERVVHGRVDSSDVQSHMETLLKAIKLKRLCSVTHRDFEYRFPYPAAGPVEYLFLPQRLTSENEALCVEGWKVLSSTAPRADHPLTFGLHRIVSCAMLPIDFSDCPPLPEREGVFGLIGYKGFPARVSFSDEFAGYIRERVWSEDQEIIDLGDGEIELRFTAADEGELVRWVLGFGYGAELLEPERLRDTMREEIYYMREYYEEEKTARSDPSRR